MSQTTNNSSPPSKKRVLATLFAHGPPVPEEKPKAPESDYASFYANWETYPEDKILLPGERLWAKKLPGGLIGLNNDPLHEDYRLHDILRGREVVHRRWNLQVWYHYQVADNEEADLEIRKNLHEALKDLGMPGFFWAGNAYVFTESEDAEATRELVVSKLKAAGIECDVEPLWRIRGEEPPVEEAAEGEPDV